MHRLVERTGSFHIETLLIVVRIPPGYHALASLRRVIPVLHIVLLRHPSRTRVAHVIAAQPVTYIIGCVLVDEVPPPHFGFGGGADRV